MQDNQEKERRTDEVKTDSKKNPGYKAAGAWL
jgi:hypothetical protein